VLAVPGAPADPTTPIATVADLQHLAATVDLSEFDVAQVRRGQRALVGIDALGGRKFPGRVAFEALSGVDNGGVVSFPVRVALDRVAGVKPGMNVSVRIVVAQRLNVVLVPLEAVHEGPAGKTVAVVDGAGHATTRRVTLGLSDNKSVEVRRGLRPGEHVLLAGGP
jgi:HlyD family secretion protein